VLVRAFAAWGVERVRLTGGEPTVRQGLVDLVADLASIRGPSRPAAGRDDHQRLAPAGAGRTAARRGPGGPDRQPRQPAPRSLRQHHPPRLAAPGCSRASTRPPPPASPASRSTPSRCAASTTTSSASWRCGPSNAATCRASSRSCRCRAGVCSCPASCCPPRRSALASPRPSGAPLVADAGEGVRGLGPATYWRVAAGPHAGRRVGVIAAMTENFCATCNRLRVSATGQLHNCLARDDTGDLRSALRPHDPGLLATRVRAVLGHKQAGHEFHRDGRGGPEKAMISIGG
jgi:cyclic pyranopterin phosphate synthase